MSENEKPNICIGKDVEIIASNPDISIPTMVKKKRSQLERKKRLILNNPCSFKSKGKKVISDKPRKLESDKRKRTNTDDLYYDDDSKISVKNRADEVLETIPPVFPSFIKHMLPSNVSYSFWLILPTWFCKSYLPREDAQIILMDECGEEVKTKYLMVRHGLSAGWRRFSISHRLQKGDILIFHLISPCKLKVDIVRVYGLDIIDAALILMHIQALGDRKKSECVVKDKTTHKKSKKRVKTLSLDIAPSQDKVPNYDKRLSNSELGLVVDRSEIPSDDFDAAALEVVDSGFTDYQQSNECNFCGSYLQQEHFRKDIYCR